MTPVPLSGAKAPFRVWFERGHGFLIQDAEGREVEENGGQRDGPTCAKIAARLNLGEGIDERGIQNGRRAFSLVVSSYALVLAGAVMVGAKIWAAAPLPWWLALLPLALLCLNALLACLVVGGITGLLGLGAWFARRRS